MNVNSLSPAANELLDQLVDILHDGEAYPSIAWYPAEETPPYAAIEELTQAGFARYEEDSQEITLFLMVESVSSND